MFTQEEHSFIIEKFAEGLTSKEVAEAFYAEFRRRLPPHNLLEYRRQHRDEVQKAIADEVETAYDYLSPAGLLRHAYRMLRKLKDSNYAGRLSDIATLLRFASDMWDKYNSSNEMREKMKREIEQELKEMMTFFEENKELIETAQRHGLLRFAHLQVGGEHEEAQ